MHSVMRPIIFCLTFGMIVQVMMVQPKLVIAQTEDDVLSLDTCENTSTKCILDYTAQQVMLITDQRWRDQSIRDLVMRYADAGFEEDAFQFIPSVTHPDTRAMSIRAAGMGRAKYSTAETTNADIDYFKRLKELAKTIDHDGARAIAYTYIAMSEAFAGLDENATKTALSMSNSALRNKALAESAEIQAERFDIDAALDSISYIDNDAFKDKAYTITSEIFIKTGHYPEAVKMASHITNAYKQSKVLLKLTAAQINDVEKRDK
jgi:hypothetical protein